MTGTLRCALALARAGRMRLLVWPLAMAALAVMTAVSIDEFYAEPASRAAYAAALEMADVMTALGGASGGLAQLGGIIANELAIMVLPAVAIAGVMLAVASTRAEEDAGRTELVTARPVAHRAPLLGAFAPVTASLLLLAALIVGAMTLVGVPLIGAEDGIAGPADGGALGYGMALAAYGLLFSGVGFVVAELARDARSARMTGLAVVALAYLVRVGVNGAGRGVTAGDDAVGLSWITPVGWFDAVAPFAHMRWSPLLVLAAAALALHVLAIVLRGQRDLGAGLIAARPGPVAAPRRLGTPLGLAWRLARGSLLGWLLGVVALAALMGSQLPAWIGALQQSEAMLELMGMDADASAVTNMTMAFSALLAASAGIGRIGALAEEEDSERLALTLSRPVGRVRLWSASVGVALAGAAGILIVAGLVYAATGWVALQGDEGALDAFSVPDTILATAVLLAPTLLLVALAAAWTGWTGRSPWPAWALLGASAAILFLGPGLDLPEIVIGTAPLSAVGSVPVDDPVWGAVAVEAVLAAAAVVLGALRFARRDVP